MNYQAKVQESQRVLELGYAYVLDGDLAVLEELESHLGYEVHFNEVDTELKRLGIQLTTY